MHRDLALDFDSLLPRLGQLAEARGWSLAAEARVDSTNRRVGALVGSAEGGGRRPALAVANEQTAGVGRRGARWQSGPGDGLWFSLAVPAGKRLPEAPAGLALAGRLAGVLQGHGVPVVVKWPNDLYLEQGKLGGLMIERRRLGGVLCWVAGVGINWRHPAGRLDADYRPASLGKAVDARRIDSVDLALALIEAAIAVMTRPEDWPAEIALFSRAHHGFGEPVVVERGDGTRETGIAGPIRPDGELEVGRSDGRVIRAGTHDRVRLLAESARCD
ncbi:MAG: biotin--[acetyl-CoA-carboxylase] ligase [Guyparkeria sp.]